jgi:hypothetical protein
MKEISRYTKGRFGRIEKHDSGEFVYFCEYETVVNEKNELIGKLSKNNEFLYSNLELCKLSKQSYKDKLIQSKLSDKKHTIIMFMLLVVNAGPWIWIWLTN